MIIYFAYTDKKISFVQICKRFNKKVLLTFNNEFQVKKTC